MRNINELIGIINGISDDGIINQIEVAKLSSWVKKNRNLSYEPNQAQLISLVDQVLEDGIINDDERKKLMNYCSQYAEQELDSFAKMYELNGIIERIICDNVINEKEIYRLREWTQQNSSIVRGYKSSDMICEMIDQILEAGDVTFEEQETLLSMLSKGIIDTQLESKIEYLKRCVKERKNIGIDLIDLLDNADAIDVIHGRAERELVKTLNTYSGTYVHDPEIVFISLVLIGMLYYDGTFYDYVRKTYKYLYQQFSEQKVEGLIRTIINRYRTKDEISQSKSRIINVVLAGSIVPSYYLGSFFEFIYDIYKLNFDSDLPQDLYEEFQFVYDGLQNAMRSDSDEVQVNVTKKTYKLIKSTKQLITNPMYNDAVIKLSIIVVRLIDKYIWGKEVVLYNPYLKRGCEQWLASMKKEREQRQGQRKRAEQFRSRWEPEYVLNGNIVSLVPPVHRVKSFYDYRDIRVVVKNGEQVIYEEQVTDIREIIGGFYVKNNPIELPNPLGNIAYQLVAGDSVIYDSKTRLYRDFIVFDEEGCELTNNRDYSGTVVVCTRTLTDTFHPYFDSDNYHLSSYNARLGDTIFIDNTVFNFSEMIHSGIFGKKHERCFIALENSKIEVFKKDVILLYEYTEGRFEIQINYRPHRIQEFEYSITERNGVNKYTVKLDELNSGIYDIKVYALNNGKRISILQTKFAIDKNLQIEQVEESGDMYVVSIASDLIEQSIIEEIDIRKFKEDWLKFEWNGITYTYYVPLCFKLYRIDGSEWVPFSDEIWIGDIVQDSVIDIYGQKYDGLDILTSTGKTLEETPTVKDEGVFCRIPAGYLLSYKTNYDYIGISLLINGRFRDGIFCYNRCVLDENKTFVNYSSEDKALIVTPYFYGKGNIRFKIVDDSNNTVYTSSSLEKGEQEYVFDLVSFVNYKVVFFEKERGLSLKKERLLKEFQIVFYDREDFVGKSFKIKEVYFDQSVRGEFLRKKHYFNKTYVYFKEMLSGNEYIGEVYVRTYNGVFMLDNINPVDIEICSDVIDGSIELSITKDGDGLLLDFDHHGIMNSMDDDKAVDIYSYSIDMKGVESA